MSAVLISIWLSSRRSAADALLQSIELAAARRHGPRLKGAARLMLRDWLAALETKP